MPGTSYARRLILWIESAWRDFVRGHTVGQRRDLGFIGPFPFLLITRWAVLLAALLRFGGEAPGSLSGIWVLSTMFVLAIAACPITYRHRKQNLDGWQTPFIVLDALIVTYLVWWTRQPQSDVFLLYLLPLLTAAEYVGGWSALVTFAFVSVLFGIAIRFSGPLKGHLLQIYVTREIYLAGFQSMGLCLFQITGRLLGDVHQALREANDINADWLKRDAQLDAVLHEVAGLGFEFVGLSTVDPYHREVVMTRAVNIPAGWMRRSRRQIDAPNEIIADVLRTRRVETPAYDDPRFDLDTYKMFRHEELARVYVPLFNDSGGPVAVVQAGWERRHHLGDVVSRQLADKLQLLLSSENATLIANGRPHVFLEEVCQIVLSALQDCAAVTLHLYRDGEALWMGHAGTYSNEYVVRLQNRLGLPRSDADSAEEWVDRSETLRAKYRVLYEGGCRSLAMLPLQMGAGAAGFLTCLFHREQRFGKWLIEQIRLLGRAAESAIQTRLLLIDAALSSSRAWMQSRLKTVEDALTANAPLDEVLQRVAEHFLYNLEADCVTLYEFDGAQFRAPPITAGNIDRQAISGTVTRDSFLWQCLEKSSQFYRELPLEFRTSIPGGAKRFVEREGIKSCAMLVLKTEEDGENEGLIFVNFRRTVGFSPEVRVAMATLAASAAVAIRTARQIDRRKRAVAALHLAEAVIAMSGGKLLLDPILQKILRSACELTGARKGLILWFTPNRSRLEWRVAHLCDLPKPHLVRIEELPLAQQVMSLGTFVYHPGETAEKASLLVPLRDSGETLGMVLLEGNLHRRSAAEDALTVEMLGVLAVAGARFTALHRPLLSLSAVAAHLQEQPLDLDTALRSILTGVTAGEGLGFTRAMVFLREGEADQARGRIAVGPLTGAEALETWRRLDRDEQGFRSADGPPFGRLLDLADEFSSKVREGAEDSRLSVHVKGVSLPFSAANSKPGVYGNKDSLPLMSQGDWKGQFACVPLMVKAKCSGFLLADRNFQDVDVTEADIALLRLFADVAAIAIERLTARRITSETERIAQWEQLFSEATHKIGTCLTVLDGYVVSMGREIAFGKDLGPGWNEFLKHVRVRIAHASWMAKKVQPGKKELRRLNERVDLFDLLEGAVLEAKMTYADIDAQIQSDGLRPMVSCDPIELRIAFQELLKNGQEAIGRSGMTGGIIRTELSMEEPDSGGAQMACIYVMNNGPAIAESQWERVFDPQYSTKKEAYHGHGLSAVKRETEAIGGSIRVIARDGEGACFEVRLPATVGKQHGREQLMKGSAS